MLSDTAKKVLDYIKKNSLIDNGDTLVVGLSGGADSISLTSILLELRRVLNISIVAVHIHHGIRGEEANRDMNFVKDFCDKNEVELKIYKYDIPTLARENHMSEEEMGRTKRYEAFHEVRNELIEKGVSAKIAVAHNENDSAETLLFNLFRGSGIKGLGGISVKRDEIIRPILCLKRKNIEEYLEKRGIEYILDGTNLCEDYTRNKIRLKVLPYIEENINESVVDSLTRTATMIRETENYLDKQAEIIYPSVVDESKDANGAVISILLKNELVNEDVVIRNRIIRKAIHILAGKLKDITYSHILSVDELFSKQVSREVNLSYELIAKRNYDGIIIEKGYIKADKTYDSELNSVNINVVLNNLTDISSSRVALDGIGGFNEATFTVKNPEEISISPREYTKAMDYDILKDGVTIRHRQSGDYIVVGRHGEKKKLKELFINLKIPKEEREKVLLLARDNEVFWVVGHRMSESVKVTKTTTKVIEISFK